MQKQFIKMCRKIPRQWKITLCAVIATDVYGTFLFAVPTLTGITYLYMLKSDTTTAAGYGQGLYFSARERTPTILSWSHWISHAVPVWTGRGRPYASGLLPLAICERRCLRPTLQRFYINYDTDHRRNCTSWYKYAICWYKYVIK